MKTRSVSVGITRPLNTKALKIRRGNLISKMTCHLSHASREGSSKPFTTCSQTIMASTRTHNRHAFVLLRQKPQSNCCKYEARSGINRWDQSKRGCNTNREARKSLSSPNWRLVSRGGWLVRSPRRLHANVLRCSLIYHDIRLSRTRLAREQFASSLYWYLASQ